MSTSLPTATRRRALGSIVVAAVVMLVSLAAACTPATPSTPNGSPPDAVAAVVATARVRSVALGFVAPAAGSGTITRYEVSVNVGSAQPLADDHIVTGLDENATYAFRVRACSAAGCGLWSPKSNSVKPRPPVSEPEAAKDLAAQPGDRAATLTYTAGADGGSPITTLEVSVNEAAAATLAGTGVVGGLTNGVSYSFRMRACNAFGCATWSSPSNVVVPRGVPAQPNVGSSVSGTTINWSWNVPNGNGAAVSGFDVKLDGTLVQTGMATSFSRAFGHSETHTLTVTATNAAGPGASGSASARTADPATYREQQGSHGVNTFTNYHNASGMGPWIAAGAWVNVSCKVYDPTIISANPDGYWYRIADSPWNNAYYAPANTFMNGDPWGGPYTHNTDFAVPNC
jgi:hypothetical protein